MKNSLGFILLAAICCNSLAQAVAPAPVASGPKGSTPAEIAKAQSDGGAIGTQLLTSSDRTPEKVGSEGSTPGPKNVWGADYTGTVDSSLTSQKSQPSMVGIGDMARSQATTNFTGYNNTRSQQSEQATYFLSANPIIKPSLAKTDPIFDTKTKLAPDSQFASETAKLCVQQSKTTPDVEMTYICNETFNSYVSTCTKEAVPVCEEASKDGCDVGGIIQGSWSGDMETSFIAVGDGDFILQFGTIGDNYWGGWGTAYDRTLTFSIFDTGLITKFELTQVKFDDYVLVKLNDHIVYSGPYGGDRLELVPHKFKGMELNMIQYCADCFGNPELKTEWNFWPHIDLRPYLKAGENKLFVRTMVAGGGESAVRMTTRQKCLPNCHTEWKDYCMAQQGMTK